MIYTPSSRSTRRHFLTKFILSIVLGLLSVGLTVILLYAMPLSDSWLTTPGVLPLREDAEGSQIQITEAGFLPSVLTATVGIPVVWVNDTMTTQHLRSGLPQALYLPMVSQGASGRIAQTDDLVASSSTPGDGFFSATLAPGISFTYTFTTTGTFSFYLTTAPEFTGAVVVVPDKNALPPDPATVAPPLDQTISTGLLDATAFLYTGDNPIQTGIAPGTIELQRVSVLRGRALSQDNTPLPGVAISVLGHPAFGQTRTRADGLFDLVVNGGGLLVVQYEKDGFLPAQRQVDTPWQEFSQLPDVVLIPLDSQVTTVTLSSLAPMQVVRGSVMSDADGARQTTVLFPRGMTATMELADGTVVPLSTLRVRATEYTVGVNGPNAMPGELPPSSGYTYAVELSADEAIAVGAQDVQFSTPVPFYVENFVGFPVGTLVPTGFYDRLQGQWIASDNGRIIKVVSITAGMANLALDATNTIADATALAVLGITDEERQNLAALYTPGQELWRMLLPHFSPWDGNWPIGPPPGSLPPSGSGDPKPGPLPNQSPNDPCKRGGSIIVCEPQTLGQAIRVAGTPWSLNYQSDRVPGYRSTHALRIQLSGDTLPPGLQRIHLEISIAGRMFTKDFAPQTNLADDFAWDGKDIYGRPAQGQQPVRIRIGYEYNSQYYSTEDSFQASFNRFGSPPIAVAAGGGGGGGAVTFSLLGARATTPPIILWQEYTASLGSFSGFGVVGGWSLDVNHTYDVGGQTLYLGNGDKRSTAALDAVIATAAGNGGRGFIEDGGPATQTQIAEPRGVATAADGSILIADTQNHRIRRVDPDGTITTLAGNGTSLDIGGFGGDGGPATNAQLRSPMGVAIGSDGSVYIADTQNHRIRRVAPNGIINTVAGTGVPGFSGDGGAATQAQLYNPNGVAVGPDGSLYVADSYNYRIRRIGPDGIITTIAGSSASGFGDDGQLATLAKLSFPYGIAVGPDGSLYIADSYNYRIRRVGPDGIITTVAGTGIAGFAGDGGLATDAQMNIPYGVAVGSDGAIYFSDMERVRRVGPEGIITSLAGSDTAGFAGDKGPATQAQLYHPAGVAVGADGSLYVADPNNSRIRQIRAVLPGLFDGDILIAAEDGSEVYVFANTGRHLRTLDALTGDMRFLFAYDSAGRLKAITDGDGNVTSVERDGSGNPTAILAPFGQRTALTVNSDGYLSRVTDPAGGVMQFTYNSGDADGLLATLTDAQDNVHLFTYDVMGRLTRDENPAGGVTTLARTDIADGHYAVAVTTASGLVTTYEVEELSTGDTRRTRIDPGGARTESLSRTDGSRQMTYPDGTVVNLVEGPDPRWGMQAPLLKTLTVTTPGGITASRSTDRTVTLGDANNPLSLTTQTDTITINGQTSTRVYTAATRTATTTSPAGRQSAITVDAQGRIVEVQGDLNFGLAPVLSTYDSQGRLTQVAQDVQAWTYQYDAQSRLSARTDAAGNSIAFAYDAANRPTQITLPGSDGYGFAYDASGNRTEVTMPSLAVHGSSYSAVDQESGYTPPGTAPYATSYDTDGRVSKVMLPTGRTETFSYDSGGRFTGLRYPEATVTLAYASGDPTPRLESLTRTPGAGGAAQTIAFTYDGNLVTGAAWSGAAQGQYTYVYDNNFLLKSVALNSGADSITTLLTRDADGLLTNLGPFALARTGPTGSPNQISDGTLAIALGYDTLGRAKSRTHSVAGQQRYSVVLTYDVVGRITRKVETIAGVVQTTDYVYDADSQLLEVRRAGVVVERYAYDVNRNRVSRQVGSNPAEPASYDSQDRLIQQGTVAYQFNADGYLTQRGSDTFQYSTAGELIQATIGGQTITYAYDALRRRVSRSDSAGTTQYLYGNPDDALQISNSRDSAGVLTIYYYDGGRRLFALERGSSRFYVTTDPLGSPRHVIDSSGTPVKTIEYDSFGAVGLDSNPAFELPVGFAGGLSDGLTGLVRFGLRDYDPDAGRWTARDPALFDSNQANLYAYVNNNPVNLIDPVGFGSAGVGLCDGVCVGIKLAYVPGQGISACFEAGIGQGNSVEVDPFGSLDDNSLSVEAKIAAKAGIAKVEFGLEVPIDPCAGPSQPKPKTEGCIGPFCLNTGKESKASLDLDEKGTLTNPFKSGGLGVEGKLTAKVCQQAKW